jgi:hypothetical protein
MTALRSCLLWSDAANLTWTVVVAIVLSLMRPAGRSAPLN